MLLFSHFASTLVLLSKFGEQYLHLYLLCICVFVFVSAVLCSDRCEKISAVGSLWGRSSCIIRKTSSDESQFATSVAPATFAILLHCYICYIATSSNPLCLIAQGLHIQQQRLAHISYALKSGPVCLLDWIGSFSLFIFLFWENQEQTQCTTLEEHKYVLMLVIVSQIYIKIFPVL